MRDVGENSFQNFSTVLCEGKRAQGLGMSIDIDAVSGDPGDQGPITIDQIGIEQSRRYAQDQAALESKFIRDTQYVSTQSSVSVNDASYIPLLNTLMGTPQKADWALLDKPATKGSLSLFTSGCVPSLGNQDQRDLKVDTLKVHLERYESHYAEKGDSLPFDQRKGITQRIHEAKSLINVYEQIGELDTIKDTIFARLNQYHRG